MQIFRDGASRRVAFDIGSRDTLESQMGPDGSGLYLVALIEDASISIDRP
jgi:hypothetical protein